MTYRRLVARPEQLLSGHCLHGTHERCPHHSDVAIGTPWRPRPRAEHVVTLCVCDCHAGCPLAALSTVLRETWQRECTCPGAGPVREQQERADERRREMADVLADLRYERLPADEIETRLRALYVRRGERTPPGLAGWAEVVAAGTARRGTRTARLVAMGVGAVARTVRWAWSAADGADGDDRALVRTIYRGIGVAAVIAALLTTAAARSSGWRRLGPAVGAVLAWSATLWVTALGTWAARVVQVAGRHPDPGAGGAPRSP